MQNKNLKVRVNAAVFVASHAATCRSVPVETSKGVNKIVYWPVFWPVYHCMNPFQDDPYPDEPAHPGLGPYLAARS